MRSCGVVLTVLLGSAAARGADPVATAVVSGLSSGNLAVFGPVAEDTRQLHERDWLAVSRALDAHGCIDVRSFTSSSTLNADGTTTVRIDVDAPPGTPPAWIATVVETPDGPRIRALDSDATLAAKRACGLTVAGPPANDVRLDELAAAILYLDFYTPAEQERASERLEPLLDLAAARSDGVALSMLLTRYGALKSEQHDDATAVRFAEAALAAAPYDAPSFVVDSAHVLLGMTTPDAGLRHCALMDAAASDDLTLADAALSLRATLAGNNMDLKEELATTALCHEEAVRRNAPILDADGQMALGHIHLPLHNPEAAADAFRRAARACLLAADSRCAAGAYFWLAVARGRIWPDAEKHALAELHRAENLVPPQAARLRADIAGKYGNLALRLHHYDEADKIAAQVTALDLSEPMVRRNLYDFVCSLRMDERRWQEAIDACRESLRAGSATPLWVSWGSRNLIANALWQLGRHDEAFAEWDQAIATIEKRKAATGTPVDDTARFMADKLPIYGGYAGALVAAGRTEEALKIVERGRSYSLTEAMGGRALPAAESGDAREVRLRVRLDALNRARLAATDAKKAAALDREREAARAQLDLVRSELGVAHPADTRADEWEHVLELDDVLPDEQTAVIEYLQLAEETIVFVLRRSGGGVKVDATPIAVRSDDLARRVSQLERSLAGRDLDYRRQAAELGRLLLRSVEPRLRGARRWIVIPDGALWKVPFEVLPDRAGKPLIDRHVISYAPSLAMLRAAAALEQHRRPASHFLLALGNPRTSDAVANRVHDKYRNVTFGDLPDATQEVRALQRLYGAKATVFTGKAADEATAKRLAPSYRVLHFATHGVIDDAHAMYSALVLAPGAAIGDDGLLEAREIASLHLNADLAVLSACDTAEGEIYPGQGVIGISWAFLVAGCPTTVVTHWKASSAAARELMVAFHRHLRAGRPAAEALRLAQLELRRQPRYAHPFYWANFLVMGRGLAASPRVAP